MSQKHVISDFTELFQKRLLTAWQLKDSIYLKEMLCLEHFALCDIQLLKLSWAIESLLTSVASRQKKKKHVKIVVNKHLIKHGRHKDKEFMGYVVCSVQFNPSSHCFYCNLGLYRYIRTWKHMQMCFSLKPQLSIHLLLTISLNKKSIFH